jgi:hypothetical protein
VAEQQHPQPQEQDSDQQEIEVVLWQDPEPADPTRPGPKPKQLKAVEVWGFEVGRGMRRRVVMPEDVYKLAALGCNDHEIARWFDIAPDTLRYNFAGIIEKGRTEAKTNLRQAMLKNALSGNAALQIFLAKNWLGMSDNPAAQQDDKPLPWTDE